MVRLTCGLVLNLFIKLTDHIPLSPPHLFVWVFVGMCICLYVCMCICLSVCLSVSLFVCLSVCLSFCLSLCLFVCLSQVKMKGLTHISLIFKILNCLDIKIKIINVSLIPYWTFHIFKTKLKQIQCETQKRVHPLFFHKHLWNKAFNSYKTFNKNSTPQFRVKKEIALTTPTTIQY